MKLVTALNSRINYFAYHLSLYNKIYSLRNSKKAFIFGAPMHINMGDQAQTYCIERWIHMNYPEYHILTIVIPHTTNKLIAFINKIIKNNDLIFFHSGYHLTDLYSVKNIYFRCISTFINHQIIAFPQTIFFKNQSNLIDTANIYSSHSNLILLCRDNESYKIAVHTFHIKKLILYPDIVTSLIGQYTFNNPRSGVLFCIRNDVEAFYSKRQIHNFMNKFKNIRVEETDTSIPNKYKYIAKNRLNILEQIFNYYSTFKVIITDRYHGIIFSMISSTPVIAISSTDHKLSSGIKWFPKEIFSGYIYFAKNLDEANILANDILNDHSLSYILPNYFETEYYSKLKKQLNE
jgi:exopolysaccharide biosynthesis predicted pyruvyltransferase EpsI